MISQQSDIFSQIEYVAQFWDPTSKQLYPHPIATQPGQRGFKAKQQAFVSWILESSGYDSNPETILTWFKRRTLPTGWDAFFRLWFDINLEKSAA